MGEEALQIYSYIMAVISGVLFWAGFLIFGFIARRYTVVFNRSTFHTMLMLAPSGILVYSILLIFKSSMFIKTPGFGNAIQNIAYFFLFVSSVLCLIGILKFGRLVNELVKYKGGEK